MVYSTHTKRTGLARTQSKGNKRMFYHIAEAFAELARIFRTFDSQVHEVVEEHLSDYRTDMEWNIEEQVNQGLESVTDDITDLRTEVEEMNETISNLIEILDERVTALEDQYSPESEIEDMIQSFKTKQ